MKKRLLKDGWFQMFAAVGGVACVVSILGGVSTRHAPPSPAPAVAAPSAPSMGAKATALPEPAAAVAAAEGEITPPAPSSSDLATYSGVNAASRSPGALIAPPAASPPPPPQPAPQITLTGTGVGNTAGIVGAPPGGGTLSGLLSGLMGSSARAPLAAALPALPPLFRVAPSRPGIFTVGPAGTPGADTSSLRDAVYSASNGDLILIKPGTYEGPVEVLNKSVRIRGTGGYSAAVVVRWTGPGATISVRNGTLDLEKIRLERGAYQEYQKAEPGGALYAVASTLSFRGVELDSGDIAAPPLIVEQGDNPARVEAEDSRISTIGAGVLIRGPVKASFTRMTFHATSRPLAAWIDAAVSLRDCVFLDTGSPSVIHAYEGARVAVTGKQKPYVSGVRGAEATGFEDSFGGARTAAAGGGFARDIFRRGRKPGSFP
ncbi:MAG: hypothetical protein Q8T11_15970 [Elusimicrobiota bacterium]|nr:hypothetical protein [Elusimicrobiota bacterium]